MAPFYLYIVAYMLFPRLTPYNQNYFYVLVKHPLQHVGFHSFFYLVLYITQYTLSCLLLYGVAIVIHYITRIEVRLIPSYFSYAFGYRLPPIPDTLYY